MDDRNKVFGVVLLASAVWIVSPLIPVVAQMLSWALLLIVPAVSLPCLDPLPPRACISAAFQQAIGVVMLLGRCGDAGQVVRLPAIRCGLDPGSVWPVAVKRARCRSNGSRSLAELDADRRRRSSRHARLLCRLVCLVQGDGTLHVFRSARPRQAVRLAAAAG